jgi:D-glycero-alpha-D-manno-heptose-7-phosphate kinase
VLCYSGASRFSSATHARVWERWYRGEPAVREALDGLRACAYAMRDALRSGDFGAVGATLDANWRWQRALAGEIRTPAMARLEEAARGAGALGAKACGAGAGGCLVFLARAGAEADVARALEKAGGTIVPFTFDEAGVTVWRTGE